MSVSDRFCRQVIMCGQLCVAFHLSFFRPAIALFWHIVSYNLSSFVLQLPYRCSLVESGENDEATWQRQLRGSASIYEGSHHQQGIFQERSVPPEFTLGGWILCFHHMQSAETNSLTML